MGKINANNSSFRGQKFLWKCLPCRSPKTRRLFYLWQIWEWCLLVLVGRRGSNDVFSRLSPSCGLIASEHMRREKSWPVLLFKKQKAMTIVGTVKALTLPTHKPSHLPYCISGIKRRMRTGGRSWSWRVWMIVCFSWSFALLWFLNNIYLCIPLAIIEWLNPVLSTECDFTWLCTSVWSSTLDLWWVMPSFTVYSYYGDMWISTLSK